MRTIIIDHVHRFSEHNHIEIISFMKNADKPFLGIIIVSIILLYGLIALIS